LVLNKINGLHDNAKERKQNGTPAFAGVTGRKLNNLPKILELLVAIKNTVIPDLPVAPKL